MATNYQDGVLSMGVPVLGSGPGRFDGWWGKSYFADYDHGDNAYDGLTPESAVKDLQIAIDRSLINDVVYVRNRDEDITSTDPEAITPASTTNRSVAESQTHFSIIGASNVSHIPSQEGQYGVYLKGDGTTTSTPVLDWRGAFGLIENLAFHRGASTSGLLSLTGNGSSLRALGTVVSNCLFRMDSSAVGGVYNKDNWFVTVYGCTFHDCDFGVNMHGDQSTIRRISILDCVFRNQTGGSVTANIQLSGSGVTDVQIRNCVFGPATPTAGTAKFVYVTNAATGVIVNCTFPIDTAEGATSMELNGLDATKCFQTVTTSHSDPIWGLAT
jgi:hypothetical protein